MYSLLLVGFAAFVLALVLTPLLRNVCRRNGLVDRPNSRKRHAEPVPRLGGIPLLLSCLGSFSLLLAVESQGSSLAWASLPLVLQLLPGVGVIFAVGLADDLIGLNAWQKLAGQIVAAGISYWIGVSAGGFAGFTFPDWASLPLTIGWLVICTNAVNLIDGVDGLATGVGLFAAATTLVAALLQDNFALAAATMPLVGALLGFLRYNFNPATIFLGDSGSLLIGFLLGCYGVVWSQKSATILGMTAPLLALSIPLVDTGLAIVRRFLRGKPIFAADRGHIHHRLLDRGLTARKTVLVLYGLCSVAAMLSLAMSSQGLEGLVIIVFCGAAWIGIQHLGYVELGVAGRMFVEGAFRRQLSAQIALQSQQALLSQAETPEQCWTVLRDGAQEFGFCQARMTLAGRVYQFEAAADTPGAWKASVPLSETDYLELTRPVGDSRNSAITTPYVEMLARTLVPKLAGFERTSAAASPQRQSVATGGR